MDSTELKVFTINMKSLDQNIDDPIIAGAGDANGRTLRIVFTQKAAAQFTPYTKVYLKWHHQQLKINGLDVFHKKNDNPPVWEIKWPKNMLHEGDALCNIEIVDDISIAPSTNFIVHILSDPADGSTFIVSDDYSIFQQAVIDLTSTNEKALEQIESQKQEFDQIKNDFSEMQEKVNEAYDQSTKAYELAQDALDKIEQKQTADGVFLIEY